MIVYVHDTRGTVNVSNYNEIEKWSFPRNEYIRQVKGLMN